MDAKISNESGERGFSCQNRIKTGLRNRLSKENLENLITVAIEGVPLAEFDFERAKQIFKGHRHR